MSIVLKQVHRWVTGFVFLLSACNTYPQKDAVSQSHPYWKVIQEFKKQDSVSFPPEQAILFIGSSSFTRWQDVQQYFPGYTIINRGFGGSTLADQLQFTGDIIFPYKPKQIVIYCGENDLATDGVSAGEVLNRFKKLFSVIRNKFTDLPIVYVSMKPSPSRRHLISEIREGNARISAFLATQKHTAFVDVFSKMLTETGEPAGELFLQDSLHMNARGYAIWQKAIQPFLFKN